MKADTTLIEPKIRTREVSVFYGDRGVGGTLDTSDLVIQSWGKTPHVTTLRDSGFFQHPVRVLRWIEQDRSN